MAETRLERDLRELLTAELDAVHGPSPRWAGSPAARRVGRASEAARRPLFAAAAVLAAAVVLSVAMAVVVLPWASRPVVTSPATAAPTNEPLPPSVSPSASPTVGELPMGRVAISTQNGVPALAIRVVALPSSAGEAVIRIDLRVVGPIVEAVGASRFVVYHDGKQEPLPGGADPDALAIPVGAGLGTTVYAEFTVPVRSDEWADLGYAGVAGSAAFTYPLHRPPTVNTPTGCPTLADYAAASAIPSQAPTPAPSFDPVATDTPATAGTIALGTVGVIAGPDGHAGALVRVSNVRLCDRLPDARPDAVLFRLYPPAAPAQFLLADVDLLVLQDSTIDIFLPDGYTVVAPLLGGLRGGQGMFPKVFWFPGINTRTSVSNGAGYSYHGVIGWAVPGGEYASAELAIGVYPGNIDGHTPLFSYPVRAGTAGQPLVATAPPMTPLPSLTPAISPLPLDTEVVLPIDSQVVRSVVGGVQQVPRYPAVAPSTPGDVFLEFAFESVRASGDYTWNPADWAVVLPDGSTASLLGRPAGNAVPIGLPDYTTPTGPLTMDHAMTEPAFFIAEVPATGRVTLEYRPSGGPAVATWVLRGQ